MALPTLAQVSFTATMLGCDARVERSSELRSMPPVTAGNYVSSSHQQLHLHYNV